jgi:hypothetical protein
MYAAHLFYDPKDFLFTRKVRHTSRTLPEPQRGYSSVVERKDG